MPLARFPHRVTFLAPSLRVGTGDADVAGVAALLLHHVLLEHLLRHGELAVAQDEFRIADGENRLLDAGHPAIAEVKRFQFGENRRDEVLWLSLSLEAPDPVTLCSESAAGETRELASPPGRPLGEAVEYCLRCWLEARHLGAAPAELEAFTNEDLLAAARRAQAVLASVQAEDA